MTALSSVRSSLFWVSAPIFFINFALPVKSKELGASALEVGGLFSLFTLSLLVFRPLIGGALDRYGRRRFLIGAIILYVIAYAGYAFAQGIEVMYAARLLQGLGAAMLLLTVDAITVDLCAPSERATEMGKNIEAQTRSTFIGASVGFSLIAIAPILGWTLSFGFFTAFAMYALWIAFYKVPETLVPKHENEGTSPIPTEFYWLLAWLVPLGFASALVLPMYLVYLQDVFTPDKRLLSWAFLPAGLVFAFLPSKLGRLVDRFGPYKPSAVALLSLSFLYVLLPQGGHFWALVVIYTLTSVAWALIEPARKAMVASLAADKLARGFGLAEMAFGAGAVVGPLVGGYLYDEWDKAWPFYVNAAMMAVALVMLLSWTSRSGAKT